MKTKIKFASLWPGLLLIAGIIGLAASANAATYTWRGTNSTVWGTPGNWLAQSVGQTNGNYNHRLDVNNAAFNGLDYTAAQGTTLYGQASPGIRGLVIASGANGNGTMTISGGTFATTNGNAGDVIGNSGNTAILNVSGGNFISGSSTISFGLGLVGSSTLNVNSGSAQMGTVNFNVLNGTINYNGGTTILTNITYTAGSNATNNFNGGTLQPRATSTAFIPSTIKANVRNGGAVINSASFNITVAAALGHSLIAGDAAADGGLTKNGAGTLTLSSLPTYTGPTRVNAGRLTTPLPTASSSLVLTAGARFTPALTNAPWLAGSAALTNATVDFNYGSFSANPNTNATMYLTNLAISGSVTCNIAGTGFPVTNLTLLSYGSKTGGGSFVLGSLPAGAVATLNDDGANLTLNLTSASIQNLIWSTGDGIWQTNGGLNWNGNSATYLEYPSGVNDVVTFDDTASGTVTITGQVNPNATTVNITSSFYNFNGSGSIGGTNGIAKLGTSPLTINNANNFTGPVTVGGGFIYVGNSAALGATNGGTTVNGLANTLEIGVAGGVGIGVTNETVTINGTGVGGARGALRGAAVAAGQTNIWAGPVVIGTDVSRIGTEDSGNLVVAGPITDNGLNLGLLLRPGTDGLLILSGTGSTYGLTRTFATGTGTIKLGVNNAFSTNRLELGTGFVDLNGFNQTFFGVNDVSGPGKLINNGAAPSTLTIYTGTNTAATYSTGGDILDGTSTLNVVKTGLGRQTFNGVNVTYSGTTTISAGQLNISSANPINTAITVQAGASLGGESTTTNSLTFNANSILVVDPATAGSFTANTVDASAAPVKISFTSAAPTNQDTLIITAVNGITGSAANFQSIGSRGGIFYLTNANTQLMFTPSTVNASLVWKGNNPGNPTFWDTITTTNWSNGGTPDLFYAGDNVAFDDTASTYSVSAQGTVQPSSVTVNATNDYTFSGIIGGSASLTKGGTGTLVLNNNNSYTGLTVITNGVINIQTSGGLGTTASGTVITNTGTLDFATGAPIANTINLGAEVLTVSGNGFGGNGALVNSSQTANQLNAVQQVVLAGNASFGGSFRWDIRGTGNALDMGAFTLTKVGGNQISLVGTLVNNPGNIVVSNGILSLENAANLGGSSANTLTVKNGGTLNFFSSSVSPAWSLVLNAGATFSATSGNGALNHWTGPVTLNGAATLDANGGHIYIDGAISGAGSIVKVGPSGATLSVSNSYTGNTTVNVGILNLLQPTLDSGSTVTIASNAVLNLNYVGTNTVAALVLNGTNAPAGLYDATSGAPFITGTGALQVGPAAPPTMSFTSSGSSLQITFTGGTLQAQTNALSNGLGTNWVNYPGSSPVTVPIDSANGSVFFRVKQ